ncbi:MAG: hypothetical protein J6T46_04555 [Victivallales bacterium]|nr:hypothetical protein [Victivallales bacterium]
MKLEFDRFYCENLAMSDKDIADIANFTVVHEDTGGGLLRYLQEYAAMDEHMGTMRTYMVRMKETDECVAYFSLKAGLVSLRESQVDGDAVFDTAPGVELANYAVNGQYVRKYQAKGIGGVIFSHFIIPVIRMAASLIGACVVYLFALPQPTLMETYRKYGFQRLSSEAEDKLHRRLKPLYDQSCIFMFYPLGM